MGLGRPPRWTNDDWWLRRMGRQTRGEDARARDEYETRGRKNYFHAGAFAAASRRVTGVRSVDASPVERSRFSTDRESSTSPTRDASGMDGRARGRSFATTRARDDARRRDERRDARYQKYIAPIASSRASSRVAFVAVRPIHPSIHPRAFARDLAGGRPPARTTVDIPRADCASHARVKSIDTHVGPGGSPSHYFDDVKCYLFRVDNTVSRINDPRLWTLCTMVDPVHDTERHPQRRARPGSLARALARSIVRSIAIVSRQTMSHAASGVMSQSALRGAFANVKVRERANARTRERDATARRPSIGRLIV